MEIKTCSKCDESIFKTIDRHNRVSWFHISGSYQLYLKMKQFGCFNKAEPNDSTK